MPNKQRTVIEVAWNATRRRLSTAATFIGKNQSRITRWLFGVALVLYVVMQARLGFPAFNSRGLVRDDDAYGVMLKAAEMKDGCFTQDCPALNDIRIQVTTPAEDPEIAGIRNRIYHRLFVVYHPLHSLLMVGLDRLGVPFETGFDLINAAGAILIPLAVAYFVYSLWGLRGSIIALLLLAPAVFFGPGLHQIKTHSFVLGASFLVWAGIYRQRPWAINGLPVFVIAMCLFHPLGNLTSLIACALLISTVDWPLSGRKIVILGVSFGLILLFFVLPSLIHSPEFRFDPVSFYPGDWNYWMGLSATLPLSLGMVSKWADSFGGSFLACALLLLGIMARPKQESGKFVSLLVLVSGLVIFALFYIVPWYGDISFTRVWPFLAVIWISAAGAGLLYLAENQLFKVTLSGKSNRSGFDVSPIVRGTVGLLLVFILGTYFISSINYYLETSEQLSQPGKSFNPNQLQIIQASDIEGVDDTILYMDEFAMHYYMTYGGLNYGAIYYPALRFTPDLEFWLRERSDEITFIVNRNPMSNIPLTEDDGILLQPGEGLRVKFDAIQNDRRLALSASTNGRDHIEVD